jgi:hypothetical protein
VHPVYLLFWYKSANTDTCGGASSFHRVLSDPPTLKPVEAWDLLEVEALELRIDMVLSLLALLVQKYKY